MFWFQAILDMWTLLLLIGLINRLDCSSILQRDDESPLIAEANLISEGVIRSETNDVSSAPWKLKVVIWGSGRGIKLYGYVVPIDNVATLRFKPEGSVVVTRDAESNLFKYKITGVNIGGEGTLNLRGLTSERKFEVLPAGPSGIRFNFLLEA